VTSRIETGNLGEQVEASLRDIQRRRSIKKTLVLAGMVLVAVLAFGATTLMYSTDTGKSDPDQIGKQVFE
jgi:hypothetical protein